MPQGNTIAQQNLKYFSICDCRLVTFVNQPNVPEDSLIHVGVGRNAMHPSITKPKLLQSQTSMRNVRFDTLWS